MPGRRASQSSSITSLRVGFVPLVDAAPLIVALELGYFADEGISVVLERQIGWGNIRDKLTFGQLHASHCVLGMPLASHLGDDRYGEPLMSVMSLSSGGNAITLSNRLVQAGVNSATTMARWIKVGTHGPKPVISHVFNCSMHHYLLRDWLCAGGIDPDREVRLHVLPPPLMPDHLQRGHLDGFCVGEPWNTQAVAGGFGTIVATTNDVMPSHPEKVLAVSERWANSQPDTVAGLVRASLRGCMFCSDPVNAKALAAMLIKPGYIEVPIESMRASLANDRSFGLGPRQDHQRSRDWELRSFAPEKMFPSRTHAAWLGSQMQRWGHISAGIDLSDIAAKCTNSSWFRAAADSLSIQCPSGDSPPMRLRNGMFEIKEDAKSLVTS